MNPPPARDGSNSSSPSEEGYADIESFSIVSLDNFDEETLGNPVLTSPRSLEACRMLGIEPEELVRRPLDYFVTHATPGEEPALIAKRAARHENKRRQDLLKVRARRDELIDAELRGLYGSMSPKARSICHVPLAAKLSIYKGDQSTSQAADQRDFSAIEREKNDLERIRHRQAQEVHQLLAFEMRMAAIYRERDLKDQERRRKEDFLTRKRLFRQRQADEQRRRKEIEKEEQQRLETEQARRLAKEQQREMTAKVEQEEREKESWQRGQKKAEEERLRKQEEHRLQSERFFIHQQREAAEVKSLEINRRDQTRRQMLEWKKRQKAHEMVEKQKKNKMRLMGVLQDRELMRQAQLEKQKRKQQDNEARQRRISEERRRREVEIRLQAARKKESIDMVQHQLEVIDEQRRNRLVEQERQIEERLRAQEHEKQLLREVQKCESRWQEEERRRVYERMEQNLIQRQQTTVAKAEQKSMMAKMLHDRNKQLLRSRFHDAKLREEEIQAALTRRQRQDEYRTSLLMSRIESDDERARMIKEQREQLIRRRQQIKMAAARHREKLLESFHKMKITKKYEIPTHLQETLAAQRPTGKSPSVCEMRSPTQSSSPNTLQSCYKAIPRSRPTPHQRPSSAAAKTSSISTKASSGPSKFGHYRSSRSAVGDDDDINDDTPEIHSDDCMEYSCFSNQDTGQDDFEEEVNDLRTKQNEELLCILQQEHHAEEQREFLLSQVSSLSERSRMETIFNKERAQASERIMKLTQQHEQALHSRTQCR